MKNSPILKYIPIEKLSRCRYQPRTRFDNSALVELAESIKNNGVVQPIIARPTQKDQFEIIAGERRWRAAQIAGLDNIPCLVKNYSDQQAAATCAVENINRVDLNPIEEAHSYQQLISNFNLSHEEIAIITGRSRSKITNAIRLLSLQPPILEMLIQNQISEGHGKVLAGLAHDPQISFANACVSHQWSVRQLEKKTKHFNSLSNKNKNKDKDKDINIIALEQTISTHLGAPTNLKHKKNGGHLVIRYKNLKILDGILEKIGVSVDKL